MVADFWRRYLLGSYHGIKETWWKSALRCRTCFTTINNNNNNNVNTRLAWHLPTWSEWRSRSVTHSIRCTRPTGRMTIQTVALRWCHSSIVWGSTTPWRCDPGAVPSDRRDPVFAMDIHRVLILAWLARTASATASRVVTVLSVSLRRVRARLRCRRRRLLATAASYVACSWERYRRHIPSSSVANVRRRLVMRSLIAILSRRPRNGNESTTTYRHRQWTCRARRRAPVRQGGLVALSPSHRVWRHRLRQSRMLDIRVVKAILCGHHADVDRLVNSGAATSTNTTTSSTTTHSAMTPAGRNSPCRTTATNANSCSTASAVTLAKKNLLPVSARVLDWLLRIVRFARALPQFATLSHHDKVTLLLNSWPRILLLYMAETDFEFAVTAAPRGGATGDESNANNSSAKPMSTDSPSLDCGVPTMSSVEDIQRFIRKSQTLNLDSTEYEYMRMATLFHRGETLFHCFVSVLVRVVCSDVGCANLKVLVFLKARYPAAGHKCKSTQICSWTHF